MINLYEVEFLDAALSPQLADVFIADVDNARFTEIREGWVGDDNVRYKGLDYAANSYIAYQCIVDGSMSLVDRKETTKISENNKPITSEHRLSLYNNASLAAERIAYKVNEDTETFPEFTEVYSLGQLQEYDN